MDVLVIAAVVAIGLLVLRRRQERQRIVLLASHLGPFQIEKLMATLSEGYMRALDERDAQRQQQVWEHLRHSERALCEQFDQFAARFAAAGAEQTRVSTLAWAIPWADRLVPAASFDARKAIAIHARGIRRAVFADQNQPAKGRAFTLSAEMFLMQHTCHWFCKSKTIATARMLARHQTPHEQLVASVSSETRNAYLTLIKGG